MKVHIACIQMYPKIGDKKHNIQKMEQFVEETMHQYPQTQMIVFPETIVTGIEGDPSIFAEMAEDLQTGESVTRLGALAEKYKVYILYGFAERKDKDLYNSVVVLGKDGKPVGSYHKTHLFAPAEVWDTPGDEYPVFELDFGKIGIIVCWDVAFPEIGRIYALKGADLLVVCSNWEDPFDGEEWNEKTLNTHEEDWDLMCRARAFDNILPLVASNRVGNDGGVLSWFGRSKIIDARGKIIKALDNREEGILYGEVDLDQSAQLRKKYYTFLNDRRPETYDEIVKDK